MTSVFGGPQTVNQNQSTNQAINQATQQQAQSANAQAQQTQANPLAMSVGRDITQYLLPSITGAPGNVPLLNVLPMNAQSQQAISQMGGAANTLDPLAALGSGYLQQGANYVNQGAAYFPQAGNLMQQGAAYFPQAANFMQQGAAYFPTAQGYVGQGAGLMGQAGQGITSQDINSFYNPMAANVTAQMQNIFGQQDLANRIGATAASGGIGGDRAAVAQGILANQQGLAAGQTYSQLYQQALQAAQQQKAQQLAAGQGLVGAGGATAGLGTGLAGIGQGFGGLGTQLSGIGQGLGGLGTQLAGVGGTLGGLGLSGLGAAQNAYQQSLMGGTALQNQLQAAQNAAYQQQLGQYQDPYLQLQAATGAIPGLAGLGQTGIQGGLAGTQQTGTLTGTQLGTGLGATTYPAPAILPQIAGLGALGLGAMGLFAPSDRRSKTDIQRYGKDPHTGLPLYAFRYKGDPKHYPKVLGPMAQDVKKVYPEVVHQFGDKLAIKKFQSGGTVSGTIPANLLNNFPSLLNKAVGLQPQLAGLTSGLSGLSIPSLFASPASDSTSTTSTGTGTTIVNTSGGSPFSWAPGIPVSQNLSNQLAAQPASFWAGVDPQNMGLGRSNFGGSSGSFGAKRGGRVYQYGGPVDATDTDYDSDSEPDSDSDDDTTTDPTKKWSLKDYQKGVNFLNQYAKAATPKTPQASPIQFPRTPWSLGSMPPISPLGVSVGSMPMQMQDGGSVQQPMAPGQTPSSDTMDMMALNYQRMSDIAQGYEVSPFQSGFQEGGSVDRYDVLPASINIEDRRDEPSSGSPSFSSWRNFSLYNLPTSDPLPRALGFNQVGGTRSPLFRRQEGGRVYPDPNANYTIPQVLAMARQRAASFPWVQTMDRLNAARSQAMQDPQTASAVGYQDGGPVEDDNGEHEPAGLPESMPHASYLNSIKRMEGYSQRPYWDGTQWSSGFGTKAAGPQDIQPRSELENRFKNEITDATTAVDERFPNLPEGKRAALASLTYNAGPGWMGGPLGRAVEGGDWNAAQGLLQQYNRSSGRPLAGLANRRAEEANWMAGGEPTQGEPAKGIAFTPGSDGMLPGPASISSPLPMTQRMAQGQTFAQSPYFALMQAGLGALAASGQRDARGLPMSPLGAIGAGGMGGLQTYQQQQAQQAAAEQQLFKSQMQMSQMMMPRKIGQDPFTGMDIYGRLNPKTNEIETVDPATGRVVQPGQQTIGANIAEGKTGKEGIEALNKVRPGFGDLVQAMYEGRAPTPTNPRQKGELAQAKHYLHQIYPDADEGVYGTRALTRKAFASGPQGNNLTAQQTVVGHLWSGAQLADKLPGNELQAKNAIVNWARTEFGHPEVTSFEMAKEAIANEMMRVFRQVGASENEVRAWAKTLDAKFSKDQFRKAFGEAYELLESRQHTLVEQFNRGMTQGPEMFGATKVGANGEFPVPLNRRATVEDFMDPDTREKAQKLKTWIKGGSIGSGEGGISAAPPAGQREVGKTYSTPKGNLKWTEKGWEMP